MSVSATGQTTSSSGKGSQVQAIRRQIAQASATLARVSGKLQEVQKSTTLNSTEKQSQSEQLQMQLQIASQLLAQLTAQLARLQSENQQADTTSARAAAMRPGTAWGETRGALLDMTA